jgi:acetylornithine deacetylase
MPEKESAAESLVRALTGANQSYAVAYGTEAGAFQQAGVPTVVCGPGDIAQAHKPDEFIALAQLDACDDFLRKLIRHMAA